jgi:hypothetical protein
MAALLKIHSGLILWFPVFFTLRGFWVLGWREELGKNDAGVTFC